MKRNHLLFAIITVLISSAGFSQSNHENQKDNLLFLLRQKEHINQAFVLMNEIREV